MSPPAPAVGFVSDDLTGGLLVASYFEEAGLACPVFLDADAVRAGLAGVGISLPDSDFAGLLTETIEHASRIRARSESAIQLERLHVPRLELPTIADGVDLGSLYELAEILAEQGVR